MRRIDDESHKNWEGFVLYRDEPSVHRVFAEVSRRLGKSKALVERWAKKYRWRERVEEFDLHMEQLLQTKREEKIDKMADRHVAIAQQMQVMAERSLDRLTKNSTSVKADVAIKAGKEGILLERLAKGETTENVGISAQERDAAREKLAGILAKEGEEDGD